MSDLLRTFIAVKIDPQPALVQLMQKLKISLGGGYVKWVDYNQLHLTLKFLGDTPVEDLQKIKKILTETASMFSVLSFELNGLGYFKSKGQPRILYVNIYGAEILEKLTSEINTRLTELGFEREIRPFIPHLTIARIKNLKNKPAFYRLTEEFENLPLQRVTVRDIIFYQSILRSWGPEYKELAVVKFR